jgi:hypothetical protein
MTLQVGDKLPNFSVLDENATRRLIYEVMRNRPSLIVWLRHSGCQFYAEVKKELESICKIPTGTLLQLVCIIPGTPDDAKDLISMNPGWIHCLADPYRSTFTQMGFGKTTFAKILFPTKKVKERRNQVAAKGCSMNWVKTLRPGNDVLQLPGAAIVTGDGIIHWMHVAEDTADLPSLSPMLERAQSYARTASG